MLSGESAMGHFPEESVAMLARIAAATETRRPYAWQNAFHGVAQKPSTAAQAMGMVAKNALETASCAAVFIPTRGGDTARMLSRFKPSAWIVAVGKDRSVLQGLRFSYGVDTVQIETDQENWRDFANRWLYDHQQKGTIALLVAAASSRDPDASHRIEFMRVGGTPV
jgi:pyruvate kinase